jgi:hypothetical protein
VAVPLSHPARLVAESGISARPSSVAGLVERLAEAHVAIAALLGVLSRALKLRSGGGRHLELCRVGEWVDGYAGPDGAPCSAACVDAGGAYLLGLAALGLSPDGGAVR